MPPKPDQAGPDTLGPTGQPTGAPQAAVAQGGAYLTTAQGARLYESDHSLKAGARGPVLLQDHHLREQAGAGMDTPPLAAHGTAGHARP